MFPNASHNAGRVFPQAGLHIEQPRLAAAGETDDDRPARDEDAGADPLEEAASRERDYVRRRLAEELGREPSEEELNEWLRRHTEGY